MKISTFKDDLLGLDGFADRLEDFITTEHDYVEGSLVLALTSKYGSGKTTFFEMWKSSLEQKNEESSKYLIVCLNAWESDYYGDPLFAIITSLVESLEDDGKSASSLIDAAKDLGSFATAIGNQLVTKATGVDVVAAGELTEKKKAKREDEGQIISDGFSAYRGRKAAMELLKEKLKLFVEASEPKVLFLVDELDRCRPDYAIAYLETVKHIFDIRGAVFVLAADRQQLENSAKTAFGPNLDFEEYYRKFIQREVSLPKITNADYKRLASEYVNQYLEKDGERHCIMELEHYRVDNISDFIGSLKLTPRQIQEVFRILGHIFSTTKENKARLHWCLGVGSIVMASLKVGDPKIFHLLGAQQFVCEDAVMYLRKLLKTDDVEWWFLLLVTGGGVLKSETETTEDLLKRAGFTDENGDVSYRGELAQWSHGWGHSGSRRFSQIHEKIEGILKWE